MELSQKVEKPVILAVDDEPTVLGAVSRDLRREYGQQYRVMRADSGVGALELVQQLKLRNVPVALFLVDQRMPLMSGGYRALPRRQARAAYRICRHRGRH